MLIWWYLYIWWYKWKNANLSYSILIMVKHCHHCDTSNGDIYVSFSLLITVKHVLFCGCKDGDIIPQCWYPTLTSEYHWYQCCIRTGIPKIRGVLHEQHSWVYDKNSGFRDKCVYLASAMERIVMSRDGQLHQQFQFGHISKFAAPVKEHQWWYLGCLRIGH